MINFLPFQYGEEITRIRRIKTVSILGFLVLACLISLTLILFSIKVSTAADLEIQKFNFKQTEKDLSTPKIREIEREVKKTNSDFSKLSSFYASRKDLINVLEKISRTLPSGAYLTALSFSSLDRRFAASGYSKTREDLLQFKDSLEGEKSFSEVFFPASNWVSPQNINFSANFKAK